MSAILLVRHGQASFGTDDYDRLSPRGRRQSRALGADLGRRGIDPLRVVTGRMERQRDTAREIATAAAWQVPADTDHGWDEFSAADLLSADDGEDMDPDAMKDPRTFQHLLERACARWASGEHDGDYAESFTAFGARVDAALDRAVDGLGSGQVVVVVSSAGAIAWAATRLIGGGFPQWIALNRVAVNTGVTKLVVGRSGRSLIGFNDHGHLALDEVTYR